MPKYIYISASDVAAAIGENRFKSKSEVSRKILREQFHQVDKKFESEKQLESLLEANNEAIIDLAHRKIKQETCETADIVQKISNTLNTLNASNTTNATNTTVNIAEIVESEISKATGVIMETSIVDQVETHTGWKIQQRNCKMAYMNVAIPGNSEYIIRIGGRPDGIVVEEDQLVIIEVKNRQKRLFYMIPKYERIQIQLYMRLFHAQKCCFTENFHGAIRNEIVLFDVEQVQEIELGLIKFATEDILPFL